MYVVNTPTSISIVWAMAKNLLEETTTNKIQFIKSNSCEEMWTHVNKQQVEKKFGGEAADLKDKFWPPVFPSKNYLTDSEKREDMLVSKETYAQMQQEGKLEGHKLNFHILGGGDKLAVSLDTDEPKQEIGDVDYLD